MPTWYLPHGGGPCFFMEWNPPGVWDSMESFLRKIACSLPERPKAIVVASAHWQENDFKVTSSIRPELIYDYYGFPPHTYRLNYPASGAPQLANNIVDLLKRARLAAYCDAKHGFDHGVFIPLMLAFPEADIPVIQVSLNATLDPKLHLTLGQALQPLRDEGVLIIGSGMSVHNLPLSRDMRSAPATKIFDRWLTTTIEGNPAHRNKALLEWANAPYAHICHPPGGEEHLLPLLVVAGAAGNDLGHSVFSEQVMAATISAFSFG